MAPHLRGQNLGILSPPTFYHPFWCSSFLCSRPQSLWPLCCGPALSSLSLKPTTSATQSEWAVQLWVCYVWTEIVWLFERETGNISVPHQSLTNRHVGNLFSCTYLRLSHTPRIPAIFNLCCTVCCTTSTVGLCWEALLDTQSRRLCEKLRAPKFFPKLIKNLSDFMESQFPEAPSHAYLFIRVV